MRKILATAALVAAFSCPAHAWSCAEIRDFAKDKTVAELQQFAKDHKLTALQRRVALACLRKEKP